MKTSVGRRLRRLLVVLHRWTALIFGLLLVVVSTSGALIVYEPELLRAGNAAMFRHGKPCTHWHLGCKVVNATTSDWIWSSVQKMWPSS